MDITKTKFVYPPKSLEFYYEVLHNPFISSSIQK